MSGWISGLKMIKTEELDRITAELRYNVVKKKMLQKFLQPFKDITQIHNLQKHLIQNKSHLRRHLHYCNRNIPNRISLTWQSNHLGTCESESNQFRKSVAITGATT